MKYSEMNAATERGVALTSGTKLIVLPDWRQIAYVECGAKDGRAIFVCHDLPGSRMQQHPDRALADRLGARLIYADRPGFGMSTEQRGRGFRHGAKDIADLANALEVERFAVIAIGAGAPYALACAAAYPERVTCVGVAATYVPPDQITSGAHWRLRAKLALARRAPSMLRAVLKKSSFRAHHDPYHYLDRWAHSLGERDTEVLADLPLLGQYEYDTREAFRQYTVGLRADLIALANPWNIAFSDIRCRLGFWHGAQDAIVPAAAAKAFAAGLPQAEFHESADAAHFVWYGQWPAMLEFILAGDAPAGA
jgi:pimeloyl-ACP methyl ester carboxylesterase